MRQPTSSAWWVTTSAFFDSRHGYSACLEQTPVLLQVVNDIYDTLKDTEKRAAYDAIMVRTGAPLCRCIK